MCGHKESVSMRKAIMRIKIKIVCRNSIILKNGCDDFGIYWGGAVFLEAMAM
jgi:hypothetical protein